MAIEKFTTPEDLSVYVENIPNIRTTSVNLVVRAGSVDEPDELAGISHALEHCVFLKTPSFHTKFDHEEFSDVNSFYNNANTYYTRTIFETSGLNHDAMFHLIGQVALEPLFGNQTDEEMKAVRREAKMGLDKIDNLVPVFQNYVMHGKPFGRDVIGYSDKLHFTEEQLIDYYNKMYKIGNMALVVVGNTSPEAVAKLIEQNFNMSQRLGVVDKPPLPLSTELDPNESAFGFLREDSENAQLAISIKRSHQLNENTKASKWAYVTAASLLSRQVFDRLRGELGLSYNGSFGSSPANHESARRVSVNVTVDPTKTTEALDAIRTLMETDASQFTDNDLQRFLSSEKVTAATDVDNMIARVDDYSTYLAHGLEPISADQSFDNMENTTVNDVRDALDFILTEWHSSKQFEFVTGPKEAVGDRQLVKQSDFA